MKKRRLLALIVLLAAFSYSSVKAETIYSPVYTAVNSSQKIHLDSSKIDHPILDILNSSIQTPSEYKKRQNVPIIKTTSPKTKEELNPINSLPEAKIDKENAKTKLPQSFDEIPASNSYNPKAKSSSSAFEPPSEDESSAFTPPSVNNAFTPPQEEAVTEQKILSPVISETQEIPNPQPPEILPENDTGYVAEVEETSQAEDIDFEGRIISDMRFVGLNLIGENVILSQIKTRSGSTFNAERLQEDLQRIYSIGYFTDEMEIEPLLKQDGSVDLTFTLVENTPVTDVSIVGNTVFTTTELLPLIKPLKGLPENLNLINDSIEKINTYYHDKGYILAAVADVNDNSGTLNFDISEGVIDKIVYEGNNKTKDYVIERNVMTQSGTVYNEEYIKKDLAKVYSTQIFEEVDRKIDPSPDKEGEYIVTISVKEGSSNSLSVGGGIDNALGVFGSVGYNEKNLFGRGQKLSLTGMIGSGILLSDASIKNRMNYNVELNFFEPYLLNADNSLAAKVFYRDLGSYQVPLAIERRFGANAEVRHKVKGYNNLTTTYGAGIEHIHLKEGDYNKISKLYQKNHINFAKRDEQLTGGLFFNLSAGAKYSTLDDENMPRDGFIAQAKYIEALGVDDFKRTNGRLAGAITKYIPIFKKSTLSIGAKAGIKVHGDHMPEVMAFRLGGPYSIRGFKMNGVGTGDSFLMGSAELLTPIPLMDRFKYDVLKNLRFAFFIDAGKVFDPTITSTLYDRPLSAITGGVGLRVYIPGLGPISVDYGIPFTNPGHYGNKGGYFTFGTGGIYDNY